MTKACEFCKTEYLTSKKLKRFCTKSCAIQHLWDKRRRSPVEMAKFRELGKQVGTSGTTTMRGSKHWKWTGDNVAYRALHQWIAKKMGKAKECVHCGLNEIPAGMKRYFHWANISGKYKRDINDWAQLCVKCHSLYDHGRIQIILS